jgi:hypothetical protein
VYVFERTPALQESARPEPIGREAAREKVAQPAPPTGLVDRPARVEPSSPRPAESPTALRKQEQDRRDAASGAADVSQPAPAAPKPDAAAPAPAPPAPRSETAPAVSAPAPAAAPPSAKAEGAAESRQSENRQAAGSSVDATRGAPASSRLAAKRAAPSDVVAGIAVQDRDAAERDLTELIARVGGRETGRRREEEATVIEAIVPQARYAEFTKGLGRLGSWRVEAERPDLPTQVHVILRLR